MEIKMKNVKVGMIVDGTVFHVTDDAVYVDLGAHADGVIYKKGLALEDIKSCKDLVKEGDTLTAKVTKISNDDKNQQILLSRLDLIREEQRKQVSEFIHDAKVFEAKVKRVTRGGLLLDYQGVEVFMPASQIDVARVELNDYKNQVLECTVIEDNGRKVVVSRRKVLELRQKEARKADFDKLTVGDTVTGTVVKLAEFGAFVELGAIQGLIHRSEVSHHRSDAVSDVVKVGDKVTVKVISKSKGKVGLSIKALQKTPWEIFSETAKVGDTVTGKVVRKMATGMLVEVQRDVVGIINKKDYSWDPKDNLAGEIEVGGELELKILTIDVENKKMSLSKKHLEYNPWKDVTVKEGEEVSGTVEEIQSRGALVKIQGVKAFLPIGEIRSERVNDINQVLKVDDVVKGIITNLDKENWKMTFSIKALIEGNARKEFEAYLETEEEVKNTTIGDLFKDQLEKYKK
jgi:ribosomal protein S1